MRRADPLLAFVVALGAFAALSASPHPGGDPGRDVLIARECVELGRCAWAGPPTTVEGFSQGVVWHGFVGAVWLVSPRLESVQHALWVVLAFACAGLVFFVGRDRTRGEGLAAGVLFAAWVLVSEDTTRVWNSSLVPAFSVAIVCGVWALKRKPALHLALASGFVLGLGVGVHIGVLAALPPLLFVAGRWRLGAAALLAASLGIFCGGPDAAQANALALVERAPWVYAAFFASLGLGVACRARVERIAWTDEAVLLALILPLALAAALLPIAGKELRTDYVHPVLAAFAALLSLLLHRAASARWAPLGISVALALLVVRRADAAPGWSLRTLEPLAARVYAHGNHADARQRVQAPACRQLVDGLAMFSPARSGASTATRAFTVVPAEGAGEVLRASMEQVGAALIREIPSRIDWSASDVCRGDACERWQPDPREVHGAGLAARAYPHAFPHRWIGESISWRIALRSGEARVFTLPDSACFSFVNEADPQEARREGGASTLRVRVHEGCSNPEFFPCVMESRPEEQALREAMVAP